MNTRVMYSLNVDDWDRIRQWFDSVYDVNPKFLQPADFALAEKLRSVFKDSLTTDDMTELAKQYEREGDTFQADALRAEAKRWAVTDADRAAAMAVMREVAEETEAWLHDFDDEPKDTKEVDEFWLKAIARAIARARCAA